MITGNWYGDKFVGFIGDEDAASLRDEERLEWQVFVANDKDFKNKVVKLDVKFGGEGVIFGCLLWWGPFLWIGNLKLLFAIRRAALTDVNDSTNMFIVVSLYYTEIIAPSKLIIDHSCTIWYKYDPSTGYANRKKMFFM